MAILRSDQGCSWDRAQTHQSLIPYLLEETYETVDAIFAGKPDELKGELGDLLCQIVFHAQLAAERNEFAFDDVVETLLAKLIERHPHVFGERTGLEPAQVRDQWERLKKKKEPDRSILAGIPSSMPALTMAFRIGEKAGGVGFDWETAAAVFSKIDEEIAEVRAAMDASSSSQEDLEEEIGDLLFAVASLSRKLAVDPEMALKKSLAKFKDRFTKMELVIQAEGKTVAEKSLSELETLWQRAKSDASL